MLSRILIAGGVVILAVEVVPGRAQQWQSMQGPPSGEVISVLELADGTLYAGTARKGIFRRRGGEDWTKIPSPIFDETLVNALIEFDGQIWAGTSDRGVHVSSDEGDSWRELSSGLRSTITYAFYASRNHRLYLATAQGVYRRTATAWTELGGGIEGIDARAITGNAAGDLFVGAFDVGVVRSLDAGASWTVVNDISVVRSVAVGREGEILVGMFGGDVVQRSEDNGDTWIAASDGLKTTGVWSVLVDNTGVAYAGARSSGIFYSEDGGASWNETDAPAASVTSLELGPSGQVWAATNVGVASTTDNGRTWEVEGVPYSRTRAVLVTTDRVLAGSDRGGIYSSDLDEAKWSTTGIFGNAVYAIERGKDGHIYASGTGNLYTSEDEGISWRSIWRTFLFVFSVAVDTRGVVFAGTESGIYRRDAVRDSMWTRVALEGVRVEELAISPGGSIYAGTVSNSMFRSTDGGDSWEEIGSEFVGPAECICALQVFDDGWVAAAPLQAGGVWVSQDEGDTWHPTEGVDGIHIQDLSLDPFGRLLAASEDGWILMYDDHTSAWTRYGPRLEESPVLTLDADIGGTVFVGTIDRGVFKLLDALPGFVSSEVEENALFDQPASVGSITIYPNPFSSTPTIEYELSAPGRVRIEVIDALGRTVATLVDRYQSAGRQFVKWNGSTSGTRLSNGLYLVRIHIDGDVETTAINRIR